MEMKKKMEKKLTNIGLAAILVIVVFAAVTGIASAETHYNESGNYIEGINVSVNTSDNLHFNRSCINVPLTFQINTLNASATNFSVDNQSGLTTNATGGDLAANECFWVNATKAGTYWVNVSNNDNRSEYVNFTVEYSNITITTYNKNGKYIEGINVSVNTSKYFNRSYINVPLTFQINNTLNATAANFSVDNQSGLTTNATDSMKNDSWFWVNATEAGTYWVNVSNNDNRSEYANFTVEYSNITITIERIRIRPKTLNLASKGVFTAFITFPEDGYNVADINNSTVECEGAPAVRGRVSEEDTGTYIAKFNRSDLVGVPTGDEVTLNVTWKLDDGTPFEGNDTIRVINRGRWGPAKFVSDLWSYEVKKWAKKVHKKFFTSDDDAIAIPGNPGEATKRVFVSGKPANTSIVKNTFAVQHEFDDGFTVAVSAKGLAALEKIPGIQLEAVPLYHVLGKPVCGNDIIEGGEKCGEPGLPGCPPGYVCENCKCIVEETATPEPGRSCYPSEETPWGIVIVNGGSGGTGVTVAVLDTGVYKDHLDLKANIVDCKDTTKRAIENGCADRDGHGTHVAGTILADGGSDGQGIYGVAPNASLMAIKVCGPSGCWCDDIAAGIRYAAGNGANIISMSLGGDTQSHLIKDAIDYAVGEGVLVVAAAGNDGLADGSIDYPGANVKVIAVGAINSTEAVPYWSSRGLNDGDYIIEEMEVEFGAPGVAVESTWKDGCYAVKQGTSMSTPHVAGLAAKLWDTDAATTRTELQELAKLHDLHTEGDDSATGFGLPIAP